MTPRTKAERLAARENRELDELAARITTPRGAREPVAPNPPKPPAPIPPAPIPRTARYSLHFDIDDGTARSVLAAIDNALDPVEPPRQFNRDALTVVAKQMRRLLS